jgi:antitoxin VapB
MSVYIVSIYPHRYCIYIIFFGGGMTRERTAALFRHGGSQAVRLPKEFRLLGSAVLVRKMGRAVILEPLMKRPWPIGFWEGLAQLTPLPVDMRVPEPLPASPHRDVVLRAFDESAVRRHAPRRRGR